jgi:hypothetical protein
MIRRAQSPICQCGPERRATPWHLLAAVLIVVCFVGGVGVLRWQSPPLAGTEGTLLP